MTASVNGAGLVSVPEPASKLIAVSIDDCPANTKRGGDVRTILSPKTVGSTSGFMGFATVEPNDYVASHLHPYSEEFLMLVAGKLLVEYGDQQQLELEEGQGLMVPKDTPHRLVNISARQARLVFHLGPLAPRPDMGHVDLETHTAGGHVANRAGS